MSRGVAWSDWACREEHEGCFAEFVCVRCGSSLRAVYRKGETYLRATSSACTDGWRRWTKSVDDVFLRSRNRLKENAFPGGCSDRPVGPIKASADSYEVVVSRDEGTLAGAE